MMTSTFSVGIASSFQLATRPNGVQAREFILNLLTEHELVELDFKGAHPTPSFADECLGILCQSLGLKEFKSRVKLTNVPDDVKPLLRHVVLQRNAAAHGKR